MEFTNVEIEESWKALLHETFEAPWFATLKAFIESEQQHYKIFPPANQIFHAFNTVPVQKVKAVILGQDPYHGDGQAHGLCFSVQRGIKPPPSLVNIFKELNADSGMPIPKHGCLENWAAQGVLMLNSTLTVRAHAPRSHFGKGWETFTDTAIKNLTQNCNNLVFLLWGNDAKLKIPLIDADKHLILTAAHPSPFSAYRGFFGCRHFSKTNHYLISKGIKPINWQL